MSVPESGKECRWRVVPDKATTTELERSGVYVNAQQLQNSQSAQALAGQTASSAESFRPGSTIPGNAWEKAVVRPSRPGVKPFVQGAGVLSVPGCLMLSGYPVVGVVLFCVASAIYSAVLLVALFGPPEISRRGFRLLGMAEEPSCRQS